jgi:hypothetical protein
MGRNPSYFKGSNLPVEQVRWDECQAFIKKLNQLTGKNFRLTTEAEWEYAARGGRESRGYKYAGGNTLSDVAWYNDNSSRKTYPVKQKQANELGLYDMCGNIWEWCQDWYGNYNSATQSNPTGPASGSDRVIRGGSWGNNTWIFRVSRRYFHTPSFTNSNLGMRLALDGQIKQMDNSLNQVEHKDATSYSSTNRSATSGRIYGRVVDSKGEPLIGASIIEKGTTNGTIADFDGEFTLTVKGNAILEVSYVGFKSQIVNAQNDMTITLLKKGEKPKVK